jgi:hypothetical protein
MRSQSVRQVASGLFVILDDQNSHFVGTAIYRPESGHRTKPILELSVWRRLKGRGLAASDETLRHTMTHEEPFRRSSIILGNGSTAFRLSVRREESSSTRRTRLFLPASIELSVIAPS